ncbi:hypothetical protein GGI02_002495 [Coemansia sp. RSA 2322]|nr:hypothetical protein EV174_006474 [Coemansia sp. RSA 2320]KAJ2471107.1 hypothetical protein GGI02_002495 [Coemansia sp. RSA 2322]
MSTIPRRYTVIFPFSDDGRQVLLGLKKRGMGVGLWCGFGGKPEPGETIDECARRELEEECGLRAVDMQHVGVVLMSDSSTESMELFVYTAKALLGDITESDEMSPKWFSVSDLTYQDTYTSSRVWWPVMFEGHRFLVRLGFVGDDIASQEIEHVDEERLARLREDSNEP